MQTSHEFLLTEDHDYDAINAETLLIKVREELLLIKFFFQILKDLRKK